MGNGERPCRSSRLPRSNLGLTSRVEVYLAIRLVTPGGSGFGLRGLSGLVRVVVIEPRRKRFGAFTVTGEGLAVGPFGCQGAVEPFYHSVGPGTVRFDEPLLGADRGHSVLERGRVSVGHPHGNPHDAPDAAQCVSPFPQLGLTTRDRINGNRR